MNSLTYYRYTRAPAMRTYMEYSAPAEKIADEIDIAGPGKHWECYLGWKILGPGAPTLFITIAADAFQAFDLARPLWDWLASKSTPDGYGEVDVSPDEVCAFLDSHGVRDTSLERS